MHIVHVTNHFKPAWESGGVARYAYNLSIEQQEQGHTVTVLTTDGFNERIAAGTKDVNGISTLYLRNVSLTLAQAGIAIPITRPASITAEIECADIVHIHDPRSVLSILAVRSSKQLKTPYVMQAHGSFPYDRGKPTIKKLYDFFIGNNIINGADLLLALNDQEKVEYQKFSINDEKIRILTNAINLPKKSPQGDNTHNELNFCDKSKEGPSILYVGRIAERKGVDQLVDAVDQLPNGTLSIIGPDDGYIETVKAKINNSDRSQAIEYLGFVSEEAKEAAYKDADIFVQPSKYGEGLPTTVLEAAAYRTPIVATSKSNVDFIQNEGAGVVVDSGSEAIAEGIKRVYAGEASGECARTMVKNKFTWNHVAQKSITWYKEALQGYTLDSGSVT